MMTVSGALAAAFLAAAPAGGQEAAAAHWRALTLIDVEAAHRLIKEDHPGAAPELGDVGFRQRLAAAYAIARSRARHVDSYDGYQAVLAGFAVGLGDKHISSRPLLGTDTRDWAGILIARRGRHWVVGDEDQAADGPPLKGARLVSCDGIAADRFAEDRLGAFRIVWPIEAQRIQRAYWLLLDDGNPFLRHPQECLFDQEGKTRAVALKWRPIARTDLATRVGALGTRGAAGFGLRKVGEGWWIALQSFSEKAGPVVEEVRAKAEALRRAPFIVLDLRGNGGGNSVYGRLIADALLGAPYVSARLGAVASPAAACGKVWRLSPRNFRRLAYYRDTLGPQMGKEALEQFTREFGTMAAAKARGDPFTGSPRCPGAGAASPLPAPALPSSEPARRLVLLTDNSCFSSCLMVTDLFRRLGARHVGEATDANTNYMEVREDKLPSGLSMFSTLQAVAPSSPSQMGPYVPETLFEGSIANTAALEKWVQGLVSR